VPARLTAQRRHVNVLILTMFDDDASVFQAMRAGARGYLLKGAGEQEIERAVRGVADGEAIFGPAVAQRVLDYLTGTAPRQQAAFPELPEREREVLSLLAEGRSTPDIARELFLSPKPSATTCRTSSPNSGSPSAPKPSSKPATPGSAPLSDRPSRALTQRDALRLLAEQSGADDAELSGPAPTAGVRGAVHCPFEGHRWTRSRQAARVRP
jgi:hypothetical protein